MPLRINAPAVPVTRGCRALRRGRVSLANHVYLVTAVTVDRRPVFLDARVARSACDCFEAPALLGDNRLLAWVLMPDHAHWLLQLGAGSDLSRSVGRMKSGSARLVNAVRGIRGPLWQAGFHDHAIRSDESLENAARYLCENPVRAGLVERVCDYPYWGSVW